MGSELSLALPQRITGTRLRGSYIFITFQPQIISRVGGVGGGGGGEQLVLIPGGLPQILIIHPDGDNASNQGIRTKRWIWYKQKKNETKNKNTNKNERRKQKKLNFERGQ